MLKAAHVQEMERALQELQTNLNQDAGSALQASMAKQKQQMEQGRV